MSASFTQRFQETHLAIWNERDRAKRDALITAIYADDMVMYDKDIVLRGATAVSDFIDQVQSRDPGFVFTAERPIDQVQHSLRFHWKIQLRQDQPAISGIDFFLLRDEKVAELFVFMDLPA